MREVAVVVVNGGEAKGVYPEPRTKEDRRQETVMECPGQSSRSVGTVVR